MFNELDLKQLEEKGISIENAHKQIDDFIHGFPFLNIIKPAIIDDGIIALDNDEINQYIAQYEQQKEDYDVLKFVPASGAASRMFKNLFEYFSSVPKTNTDLSAYPYISEFIGNLDKFAFYADLCSAMEKDSIIIDQILEQRNYHTVIEYLLTERGLNYGNLPKGLLKFHSNGNKNLTPVEEHLIEGANYANINKQVYIHFTVSPEHQERFNMHLDEVLSMYEKEFDVKYNISFSNQKPSTDTLAVDLHNEPFRENDGKILFRPGGHGALLDNLNDINSDIIFIKNIDNVVAGKHIDTTIRFKKVLAGVLLYFKTRIFDYLRQLTSASGVSDSLLEEVGAFVQNELCILPKEEFYPQTTSQKIAYLINKLNRPIRVCGMVKAEGDTGGGPFWAINPDGTTSLQIVETAQIDTKDPEKQGIMKQSTHFNPVDLVCWTKNLQGDAFDLMNFRDPQCGFISQKSKGGKDLKALELPGLWNGSMSGWISIFVEVPLITFNPVKSVNDLLLETHQNG